MTKEESKKAAKVMLAFVEGKQIQLKDKTKELDDFVDIPNITLPSWNWAKFDYRVKPEPKYRPFKNADEAFNEAKKHGFWCSISKDEYRLVSFIDNTFIELANELTQHYNFRQFLDFHWVDTGEPCGIPEE